jgi:hypothetical protein
MGRKKHLAEHARVRNAILPGVSATITTVSLVGRVNGESFEISLDGTNSFREGKARSTCAPLNSGAVA